MRVRIASFVSVLLVLAVRVSSAQEAPLGDVLLKLDRRAAVAEAASRPAETRAALEALRRRFDQSIRSARTSPEQRKVQYDAAALEQGLRLGRIYADATKDPRPLQLFEARRQRIDGTVLLNRREYAAAVTKLTKALAEAERLDDLWLQIITRTNLAYGYLEMGRAGEALAECERANALAERSDDRSRALTGFNLAAMYMHLGKFRDALEANTRAVELARGIGNRLWEGNARLNIGIAYRQLGQTEQARAALLQARDVLHKTQDRIGIGRAHYSLALVEADLGDIRAAVADMEQALPIIREVDIRHSHDIDERPGHAFNPIEEDALRLLAAWHGRLGAREKAREYADALAALRARQQPGDRHVHKPGEGR